MRGKEKCIPHSDRAGAVAGLAHSLGRGPPPASSAEPAAEEEQVVLEVAGVPGQRDAPLDLGPGHAELLLQLVHPDASQLLQNRGHEKAVDEKLGSKCGPT